MKSNNPSFYYKYYNSGKEKTVLIIPGLGTSMIQLETFSKKLAKSVNVLIFDRYSYGINEEQVSKPDLDMISDSIYELKNQLKIDSKLDILGLSLGAAYGANYRSKYPQTVSSYTNVDCSMPEEVEESKEYKEEILYGWLRYINKQKFLSFLSVPQLKAYLSYILKGEKSYNLVNARLKHIESTSMEEEGFGLF